MINPFILKKWAALMLSSLLTTILFFTGFTLYNLIFGLIFMGGGVIISVLVGGKLLENPFTQMLEGEGILCIDMNSTGMLKVFIMRVNPPYVEGKLDNKLAKDVFNRSTVFSMAAPQKAGIAQQGVGEDGVARMALVLSEEDYNKGRFGLFHYPVLIYNGITQSLLTKDFLAEKEKSTFAEHGVLYLNRKMEELTSAIRDFGRHVVENLKPNKFSLGGTWLWIIVVIAVIILAIIFLPKLIPSLQQAGGTIMDTASSAAGSVQSAKI